MITDYHAIYYAHELSPAGGTSVDRVGRALFDACVDLNPHQIDTALFALRSLLSEGVLLADEGVHPCSSVIQIKTLRAEIDKKQERDKGQGFREVSYVTKSKR